MTIGKPRKTQPKVILENAMQVFWKKGFDGATMVDIVAATGMHEGSLYQHLTIKKHFSWPHWPLSDYRQYDGVWRSHKFTTVNHTNGKSTDLIYSDYAFKVGLGTHDFVKGKLTEL